MKRFFSLFLVICFLFSMSSVVFADDNKTTVIRVVGTGSNAYEFDVPISMEPGETRTILLEGSWDSLTTVKVTAPKSVILVNSETGDERELGIEFDGFDVVGDDFSSISEECDIVVEDIDVLFGTWEGILIYNLAVDIEKSLVHNGVIPEGGTYYVGIPYSIDVGDYSQATAVYGVGELFPDEVNVGDTYVYGDYEYKYNGDWMDVWCQGDSMDGWGVRVLDTSKTEYGEIIREINNKKVVSLGATFWGCSELVVAPEIPSTITMLSRTFNSCTNLTTVYRIPNSVKYMSGTFASCENLTGEIEINANLDNDYAFYSTFNGTVKPIVLTGSCNKLAEIAATATKGNVTVK